MVRTALLLSLAALTARAQLAPGDLVLAGAETLIDGRLFHLPPGGRVSTLLALAGTFPLTVDMAPDNRTFLCARGTAPYALLGAAPGGAWTTLLPAPAPLFQLAHLGHDRYVAVADDPHGTVLLLSWGQRRLTTLGRTGGPAAAVAPAASGSRLLVGRRWPAPALLSFSLATGRTTTLAPLPAPPLCLLPDPLTGGHLLGLGGPQGGVLEVSGGGNLRTLFSFPYLRALRLAPDGSLWVLDTHAPWVRLERRDRSGRVVWTGRLFVQLLTSGLEVYAARPLLADPRPVPQGRVRLVVQAPPFAGHPYLLLAAFAPRPPLGLPGGALLFLAPDPLLGATLFAPPPFFVGFRGVLDGRGRAEAWIQAPPGVRQVTFFVSGLILKPGPPLGIAQVLNTVAVALE